MIDVTVIIPAWNRRGPLSRAIDSCLAVRGVAVEVVVVDDGSSDGTRDALADRFGPEGADPCIDGHVVRWRRQANAGACAARNHGLQLATGEFVKFLDSDDWLLPEVLPLELECIRALRVDALVTGWEELHADGAGGTSRVAFPAPRMEAGVDDMLKGRAPITTGAIYRLAAVRQLRWNPVARKAQDWEWAWSVALSGASFAALDRVSYVHDCRGEDRIGMDRRAHDMSVDARRRILSWVESSLRETGALTQERRRMLADYHYKDRLTLCRRGNGEWKRAWSHLRNLDDSRLPPEPIRSIRVATPLLGRYRAVVAYDALKRMLGR